LCSNNGHEKRSKYRPRDKLVNPVAYVIEGLTPVKEHDSYLMDLKIKNHGAMTALTQGQADRGQIDFLINMSNNAEALCIMGFKQEYVELIIEGSDALLEVGRRGANTGSFVLRAEEMNAINLLMQIHDEQMDLITVRQMEKAIEIVNTAIQQRKTRRMKA
jgi:hypothetical protein